MGAQNMPAPNEMVWYKWWPVKALTSLRWGSLTLAQEGFYRRLYDWAAIAQPSDKRGYLYEHNVPLSIAKITRAARTRDANATQQMLKCMSDKGLMVQDENGAWGFPNFSKHQRHTPLQQRADGLGSAEAAAGQGKIGAESGQNRAIEEDTETEEEEEEEETQGRAPPFRGDCVVIGNMVTTWRTRAKDARAARWITEDIRNLVELHGAQRVQDHINAGLPGDKLTGRGSVSDQLNGIDPDHERETAQYPGKPRLGNPPGLKFGMPGFRL
jgi:hypothetical protein